MAPPAFPVALGTIHTAKMALGDKAAKWRPAAVRPASPRYSAAEGLTCGAESRPIRGPPAQKPEPSASGGLRGCGHSLERTRLRLRRCAFSLFGGKIQGNSAIPGIFDEGQAGKRELLQCFRTSFPSRANREKLRIEQGSIRTVGPNQGVSCPVDAAAISGYVSGNLGALTMPLKSEPPARSPLAEHRRRLRSRGLQRVEVQVRQEDAALVRAVAAALGDPEQAAAARSLLRGRFAPMPARSLKDLLAAAPLDGVDLDRSLDVGRDIDL
jgi:hypothetical protein